MGTFFRFDLYNKVFEWQGEIATGDIHIIPIRTVAAASKLMDLLYLVESKKIAAETAVNFVKDNLPNITG